jgi:hypothetical protein
MVCKRRVEARCSGAGYDGSSLFMWEPEENVQKFGRAKFDFFKDEGW